MTKRGKSLLVALAALAAAAPMSLTSEGFSETRAECQDGTCCVEAGSTCIVGKWQRPDRYYLSSGSCAGDPDSPAPPP